MPLISIMIHSRLQHIGLLNENEIQGSDLKGSRFDQRLIVRFLGNLTQKCECPRRITKGALCKSMDLFNSDAFDIRRDFGNRNVTTKVDLAPRESVHTRFA